MTNKNRGRKSNVRASSKIKGLIEKDKSRYASKNTRPKSSEWKMKAIKNKSRSVSNEGVNYKIVYDKDLNIDRVFQKSAKRTQSPQIYIKEELGNEEELGNNHHNINEAVYYTNQARPLNEFYNESPYNKKFEDNEAVKNKKEHFGKSYDNPYSKEENYNKRDLPKHDHRNYQASNYHQSEVETKLPKRNANPAIEDTGAGYNFKYSKNNQLDSSKINNSFGHKPDYSNPIYHSHNEERSKYDNNNNDDNTSFSSYTPSERLKGIILII